MDLKDLRQPSRCQDVTLLFDRQKANVFLFGSVAAEGPHGFFFNTLKIKDAFTILVDEY